MLRRRSPLRAKTSLARRTPLRTSKEKKTGRRNTGPDRATRELVLERDEYRCIALFGAVCCGDNGHLELHHRKPRKAGGRADRRASNSPANVITICRDCHAWIESRREEAYDAGLLVREHDNPAEVPVQHQIYGLVYLLEDGTVEPVPHLEAS